MKTINKLIIIFCLIISFGCDKNIAEPEPNNNDDTTQNTEAEISKPTSETIWRTGNYVEILWNKSVFDYNDITIYLYRVPNITDPVEVIALEIENDGKYKWYIDPICFYSGQFCIKILDYYAGQFRNVELSDNFIIETATQSFIFLYPQQIDNLEIGKIEILRWSSADSLTNEDIKIELYKYNSGFPDYYHLITDRVTNQNTYNWKIENNIEAGTYQLKITALNKTAFGISQKFEIKEPAPPPDPEFSYPNLETVWQAGNTEIISWSSNSNNSIELQLYKSNTNSLHSTISNTIDDGVFEWNIDPIHEYTETFFVKAISSNFTISSDNFIINPKQQNFNFSYPKNSDQLEIGDIETIRWTDDANLSNQIIKLELYKINNGVAELDHVIIDYLENVNKFDWEIDNIEAGTYQIKISTLDNTYFGKTERFEIVSIQDYFYVPNSSTTWQTGTIKNIKWYDTWDGWNLNIYLNNDTGRLDTIAYNTNNDNIFEWNIPSNLSAGLYYISICKNNNERLRSSENFYLSTSKK